jgi:hypothetical protein
LVVVLSAFEALADDAADGARHGAAHSGTGDRADAARGNTEQSLTAGEGRGGDHERRNRSSVILDVLQAGLRQLGNLVIKSRHPLGVFRRLPSECGVRRRVFSFLRGDEVVPLLLFLVELVLDEPDARVDEVERVVDQRDG